MKRIKTNNDSYFQTHEFITNYSNYIKLSESKKRKYSRQDSFAYDKDIYDSLYPEVDKLKSGIFKKIYEYKRVANFVTNYDIPMLSSNEKLRDWLINGSHIYMAGSSALFLYLKIDCSNINWKPTDVDIYMIDKKVKKISPIPQTASSMCEFAKGNYKTKHALLGDPCNGLCISDFSVKYGSSITNVEVHRPFGRNGGFDIIQIKPGFDISDVINCFDMSHLGFYFDGINLFASDQAIKDVQNGTTTCYVRHITFDKFGITLKRFIKYQERGFELTNAKEIQKLCFNYAYDNFLASLETGSEKKDGDLYENSLLSLCNVYTDEVYTKYLYRNSLSNLLYESNKILSKHPLLSMFMSIYINEYVIEKYIQSEVTRIFNQEPSYTFKNIIKYYIVPLFMS
jgi:hypothetical protein